MARNETEKAASGELAAGRAAPFGAQVQPHFTPIPWGRQAPSRDMIEAIREAVDFPALVEETTGPLPRRPGGRPVMVLCPFHDDRTASLAIYDDHAHCFGCGWHGDAFDWLQKRDGLDFRGALEELARRAGIPKPHWTPEQEKAAREQREYEEVLTLAARHFASRLQETRAALAYAHGRAWSDETIQAEGLGYADGGHLPDLGNDQAQKVVEVLNRWAGMVGGALVYVYREGGHVVYLAGRSIEAKGHHNPPGDLAGPKRPYLNAPYSARAEEVIVVEGQADAATLGGWDIPAVALAGSGLTGDLGGRLKRHVEHGATLYVVPDGDGRTDVEGLAEAVGPLLRVVALPDQVADVNAWAQGGATAEGFRERLDAAPCWLDLQVEGAARAKGATRDRAIEALFPLLAQLPPITLVRYKGRVTKALEEVGARDFDRFLKAERGAKADEHTPAEVLEGQYPVVAPALDFLDGLAVVTVPLLAKVDGRLAHFPYLVTSDRQMIPADGERMVDIGGRTVVLRDPPTALGNVTRWEYSDIQAYLEGNTPDPVEVYLETERLLDGYIDFRDEGTSDVLALWAMGTYLYPLFEAFPYMGLMGPKGSGKTKTLSIVAKLAFNARVSSNMSPASLFRVVQATRGMLGIDEAERLSNSKDPVAADLRLLLNAGYKRGSPAIRCEGDDHKVVEFEVYGPKMIASIRGLEDVLESRCILINMLRTAGPKGNLVVSEYGEGWARARHGLYCFALQHFTGVRDCYLRGAGAEGLNNRQAELWRPLLAIATYLDDCGADGLLAPVQEYARCKAAQAEIGNLDDWRTAVVLALYKLATIGKTHVMPKEVRGAMADFMDVDDHARVTSQWVGYRLREFGFQRERTSAGSTYIITQVGVLDILQRYDVQIPGEKIGGGEEDKQIAF